MEDIPRWLPSLSQLLVGRQVVPAKEDRTVLTILRQLSSSGLRKLLATLEAQVPRVDQMAQETRKALLQQLLASPLAVLENPDHLAVQADRGSPRLPFGRLLKDLRLVLVLVVYPVKVSLKLSL